MPSQRISPSSGGHRPEIVLIVTDLPAPLSPTSAVTLPGGNVEVDRVSACTGPNVLLTPRSSRSGSRRSRRWPPIARRRRYLQCSSSTPCVARGPPAGCGRASLRSTLPTRASARNQLIPVMPAALQSAAYEPAQSCDGRHEVVLDDRGVHVRRW